MDTTKTKNLVRTFDHNGKETTHMLTAEYRKYLTDFLSNVSKGIKNKPFHGNAIKSN